MVALVARHELHDAGQQGLEGHDVLAHGLDRAWEGGDEGAASRTAHWTR